MKKQRIALSMMLLAISSSLFCSMASIFSSKKPAQPVQAQAKSTAPAIKAGVKTAEMYNISLAGQAGKAISNSTRQVGSALSNTASQAGTALSNAAGQVKSAISNTAGKIKQGAVDFSNSFNENLAEQMGEGGNINEYSTPSMSLSRAGKILYNTPGALAETAGLQGHFITGQTGSLASASRSVSNALGQAGTTLSNAAGQAGRAIYNAPGNISVQLGGNQQFITGQTGSLASMGRSASNAIGQTGTAISSAGTSLYNSLPSLRTNKVQSKAITADHEVSSPFQQEQDRYRDFDLLGEPSLRPQDQAILAKTQTANLASASRSVSNTIGQAGSNAGTFLYNSLPSLRTNKVQSKAITADHEVSSPFQQEQDRYRDFDLLGEPSLRPQAQATLARAQSGTINPLLALANDIPTLTPTQKSVNSLTDFTDFSNPEAQKQMKASSKATSRASSPTSVFQPASDDYVFV